jgi:hypothetical protein
MKHLFRCTILFAGLLTVTFGCQKEEEFRQEPTSTIIQFPNISELTGYKFTSDSVIRNNKKLKNLINSKFSFDNSKSKINSELYGFSIDTSYVQLLVSDYYESFTFVVEREEDDPTLLENYIYTLFNDGTHNQTLISYPIINGAFDIANATAILIDDADLLQKNLPDCQGFEQPVYEWQDEVCVGYNCGLSGNHGPGEQCEDGVTRSGYNCTPGGWVVTGCSGGNGGGDGGNGGTTTGGNVPTGNSTIGTQPLENNLTMQEQILNCLNGPSFGDSVTIDVDLFNSWSMSLAEWSSVLNYLNNNNCNEEAQNFALLALEAFSNNNQVNFTDKIVIDSSFSNNEKANCVYERIKQIDNSVFTNILSSFDNNKVARLTLKVDNIPQTDPNYTYNAMTLPRYNGNGSIRSFDIVLDQDYLENASLLEIALTLVHEAIHAEIFERCIQLGIITAAYSNSNWLSSVSFNNGQVITTNFSNQLFAVLVDNYSSYGGGNSNPNWQHDVFSAAGYRNRISDDLSTYHPLLDDTQNPFANNLNNGTIIDVTMTEYFDLMTWLGLEETEAYNNLTPLEITKLNQIVNQTNIFYNEDCN